MKHSLTLALTFQPRARVEQRQEQQPDVTAIGEGMADLLGTQREIRALLGKPSLADEVWARIERGEQ